MIDTQDGPSRYVVYGSSIGWLALYGAVHFKAQTVGVEIMGHLVEQVTTIAIIACVRGA